jgi:RNA 3'-terminal phosphate cyclase (ATP)
VAEVVIDGSFGEGGGQILRSALALSVITGQPIRIERIRQGRNKPGLLRQHLASLKAAAAICSAEVTGAELGSKDVTFAPGPVRAGTYEFSIGSAGSANLVLQTVIPPLLLAGESSRVTVEGGTHNPASPPFDFLEKVYRPQLEAIGARLETELLRVGFYPVGGGRVAVTVHPFLQARPLSLLTRGALLDKKVRALVARLPRRVAERELVVLARRLGLSPLALHVEVIEESSGPGNAILVELCFEHVHELVAGFGERGVLAEHVAELTAEEVQRYLAHGAPVGEHLADQLLLPLAIGAGGRFRTGPLSSHTETNLDVIRQLLPVKIEVIPAEGGLVDVEVEGARLTPSVAG